MAIKLRAPEPADVDLLFLWENDQSLYESLPNPAPVSRFQMWEYINSYKADPFATHELRMVVVDGASGNACGTIDLFEFDPVNHRAGVGIYIDEDYRGRGLAKEALQQLEQYSRTTLGLHQLWAVVAVDNQSSRGLFTSCGYKPSGRLRSWIRRGAQYADALMFQKLFAD